MKEVVFDNNFWKENRLTLDKFKELADTGDIILFRSKAVAS